MCIRDRDSVVRDLEAMREAEADLKLQNSRLAQLEADSAKLKQERKSLATQIDRIRELESQRNLSLIHI